MPGLTMVLGPGAREGVETLRPHALEGLSTAQDVSVESVLSRPRAAAFFSSYPSYPRRAVEAGGLRIFLEGTLEATDDELGRIVGHIVDGRTPQRNEGLRELRHRDGEFVLMVHRERDERVWVLNDAYGHLPVYRVDRADRTLLSRDFGLACRFAGPASPDPLEVAAFLSFTFVPGDGTLHPEVRDLDAGTLLSSGESSVESTTWGGWKAVAHEGGDDRPVQPSDVADALLQATRRRHREARTTSVMSLSGGLDSRAIVSCLRRLDAAKVAAVTFRDRRGTAAKDLDPARQVAEAAGLPWELMDLEEPGDQEESELFRLKRGMNPLRMSFILPFFRGLIEKFGPDLTYFTGDSGLAFRSLLPGRPLREPEDFLASVFSARGRYHRHPVYHPDAACRIAGISRGDFDQWFLEEVSAGDSDAAWAQRFLWFTLEGYGRRWHYEGMDRNRQFFWLAAPLEATPVLNLILRVREREKNHFAFYGAVLRELDPELGSIPKAGQRFSPGSLPQRARGRLTELFQSLPAPVVHGVRGLRGTGLQPVPSTSFPLDQLRRRWESSSTCRSSVDLSALLEDCDSERCFSAAASLLRFWEFVDGTR